MQQQEHAAMERIANSHTQTKTKKRTKEHSKANATLVANKGTQQNIARRSKLTYYIVQATESASDSDEVQGMFMLDYETLLTL